jgi:hypothetical protein
VRRDLLIGQLVQIRVLVVKVFVYALLSVGRGSPIVTPATIIVVVTDLDGGFVLLLNGCGSLLALVLVVSQVEELVSIEVGIVLLLFLLVLILIVLLLFLLLLLLDCES